MLIDIAAIGAGRADLVGKPFPKRCKVCDADLKPHRVEDGFILCGPCDMFENGDAMDEYGGAL
jgi:hypothetical protein